MRIVSVEKYYFTTGGASRVFFDTNDLLSRMGHQVIPFSCRYPQNIRSEYEQYFVPRFTMFSGEPTEKISPIRKLKAFSDAIYARDVVKSSERIISRFRPDIVHLHTILYQISPSSVDVYRKHRIPVVQTMHDFSPFCATLYMFSKGKICERCKMGRNFNILLQNCYNRNFFASLMAWSAKTVHGLLKLYPDKLDVMIVPSRFVKDKLIEWGAPEHRIVHLPHFLARHRYQEPEPCDEKYIVFAGYLVRQKGIFTLLEAMRDLKELKLKVFGRGPDADLVNQYIRENRMTNVELCGFKSRDELSRIIQKAMCVVFPSECYETFGMGILEAYASGRPVIASDLGAYSEIVKNGETGYLFEPGCADDLREKILLLTGNPSILRRLGTQARSYVEAHFQEDDHYRRLMEIYSQTIDKR